MNNEKQIYEKYKFTGLPLNQKASDQEKIRYMNGVLERAIYAMQESMKDRLVIEKNVAIHDAEFGAKLSKSSNQANAFDEWLKHYNDDGEIGWNNPNRNYSVIDMKEAYLAALETKSAEGFNHAINAFKDIIISKETRSQVIKSAINAVRELQFDDTDDRLIEFMKRAKQEDPELDYGDVSVAITLAISSAVSKLEQLDQLEKSKVY